MPSQKREAARREREGKSSDGMGNVKTKGENFYRSAKRVKQLSMYKDGKPQRNAAGRITKSASYQSNEKPIARVEPNRKWFTNSRVIGQDALAQFREAVAANTKDPHTFLMKQNKLPMSLIRDNEDNNVNGLKAHAAKIAVETSPYAHTFGPKVQRKRVKIGVGSMEDLADEAVKKHDTFLDRQEEAKLLSGTLGEQSGEQAEADDGAIAMALEPVLTKGQSKRIWNELYKVIDSSDVLLHILDARDPEGTRCRHVEQYLRNEAPHKHLVFLLNKCDLIPSSVAARWVTTLNKEYPTIAFHASLTNPFGKAQLISLLRQFSSLHKDRKQISVGMVGYPNTGKSSIINTLRKKKVCTVAPIPGETKVWQYVTMMKRIYLIDCPGIVPPNQGDKPEDIVLRGVVRPERLENPAQYIEGVLARCKTHHVQRTYGVKEWSGVEDYLEKLAKARGKLLKGGEPDMDGAAKIVLTDFHRGRLPWYIPPPVVEKVEGEKSGEGVDGQVTAPSSLRKRKRDDIATDITEGAAALAQEGGVVVAPDDLEESFDGFDETNGAGEDEADGFEDEPADEDEEDASVDVDDSNDEKDVNEELGSENATALVASEVDAGDEDDEEVEKDLGLISSALASARKRRMGK